MDIVGATFFGLNLAAGRETLEFGEVFLQVWVRHAMR
jgi:hypothetical protein